MTTKQVTPSSAIERMEIADPNHVTDSEVSQAKALGLLVVCKPDHPIQCQHEDRRLLLCASAEH